MKALLIGLTLAALAAGGTAIAQSHSRHGPDRDGDGIVTRAEATAKASEMFARMDVNKDGKLDAADREARMGAMFDRLDADHNGQITRAEFMSGHSGMGQGGIGYGGMGNEGKMGHGGMGRGHMMGMMAKMADTNGDGAVSQAEFMAAAMQHFDRADANHDGSISAAEREAARSAMRAMMHGGAAGMDGSHAMPDAH